MKVTNIFVLLFLISFAINNLYCQDDNKDTVSYEVKRYNLFEKKSYTYTEKDAQSCLIKAKNGDTTYMHRMAWLYVDGLGIRADEDSAFYWIQKAAATGDAASMCGLGWFYEHGKGTEQDFAKAFYWYKKSADKNYAAAECDLGFYYEYGHQVVPKDLKQAQYWFGRASMHGDNTAKEHLRKVNQLLLNCTPETDYELAAPIPKKNKSL